MDKLDGIDAKDFDLFLTQYKETALWSSTDDQLERLDESKDSSDLSTDCEREMAQDCLEFYKENQAMIESDPGQAGSDFWLTRNGHGAGFWDGDGWKENGEILTEKSKAMGEAYLYLGDDGQIHQFSS